ncbi:MAG: acyl-CoA carboxylase [Alphaproteobacteria bacterium]|nr:acyl-CoA carboxylase [Alphaproteobacteria bacterium]MCB9930141.1 acyl-CoA carboxylase [Alphaproteobacteria bacterium]
MSPTPPTARDRAAGIAAAKATTLDKQRPEAMAKRTRDGKLSARQRIDGLLDAGSFLETGGLAAPHHDNPWNQGLTAPADGIVTGAGRVGGRPVVVVAHDFTVHGGSVGVAGSAKNNRAIERATEAGLPLVMLVEGGGHRIQDGQNSRHFAAGSRVFHLLGMNSGWTPMAVAVMGAGFAGPSNYASLADFVVMVRGGSQMGMAGPALVKAGIGETIDKEALGGAKLQADKYGIADLAVETEAEVLDAVRRFLSYLPSNSAEPPPLAEAVEPPNAPDALYDLVPADQRQTYDVRKVIDGLVDGGSRFELKPTYARNIVTGFARLAGRPVAIVANNPRHLGGMLDAKACEKAARFVALADAYGLPLITLIDIPGFAIGSAAEATGMARRSGRLLFEMAHVTVPRLSLSLRKGYGAGYIAMGGGRSFDADYAFAWPTAEICAMSVEGAVDVAFRRDYETAPDPMARRQELIDETRARIGARHAAEGFGIDDIIDPAETREVFIRALASLPARRPFKGPPKRRSISPI